jgi:biotin synthase-related radical SAM superfamily protein
MVIDLHSNISLKSNDYMTHYHIQSCSVSPSYNPSSSFIEYSFSKMLLRIVKKEAHHDVTKNSSYHVLILTYNNI